MFRARRRGRVEWLMLGNDVWIVEGWVHGAIHDSDDYDVMKCIFCLDLGINLVPLLTSSYLREIPDACLHLIPFLSSKSAASPQSWLNQSQVKQRLIILFTHTFPVHPSTNNTRQKLLPIHNLQLHNQRLLLPQRKNPLISPVLALLAEHRVKMPQHRSEHEAHLMVRHTLAQAIARANGEGLEARFVVVYKGRGLGEGSREPTLRDEGVGLAEV